MWRNWTIVTLGAALLAVVGFVSFAFDEPEPCPEIGGEPIKVTCYYYETITAINKETKELSSKVAESVIDESQSKLFNRLEMNPYKDIAWHIHLFQVESKDFEEIQEKGIGKSYMFVVKQHDPVARICRTKECDDATKRFESYKKSV